VMGVCEAARNLLSLARLARALVMLAGSVQHTHCLVCITAHQVMGSGWVCEWLVDE
jgi:hypothetical protein